MKKKKEKGKWLKEWWVKLSMILLKKWR